MFLYIFLIYFLWQGGDDPDRGDHLQTTRRLGGGRVGRDLSFNSATSFRCKGLSFVSRPWTFPVRKKMNATENLSCLLRAPGTQAPQYLPPDSGPNQSPTELVSELQALLSLFDWLRSQLSSQPCILLTPASYTGLPVLLSAVERHRLEDQFYSLFTAFTDLQSVVLQFQVKDFL